MNYLNLLKQFERQKIFQMMYLITIFQAYTNDLINKMKLFSEIKQTIFFHTRLTVN